MKDIEFTKAGVKLKHTQRPQLGSLHGERRCWERANVHIHTSIQRKCN